ncbi:MAG: DUF1778 domain-containing protein [Gammaproteobacteria bacterium]|nr:DUF1778 domain-containing protein [Gammaproteobacteria bacterium]
MNPEPQAKSERIDIRTTQRVKRTLQEAAAASHKTVSEFLLDSALTQAAEVLADRRLFLLDDTQWEAFLAALDAPAEPMPRLERLLREPSVLDGE